MQFSAAFNKMTKLLVHKVTSLLGIYMFSSVYQELFLKKKNKQKIK